MISVRRDRLALPAAVYADHPDIDVLAGTLGACSSAHRAVRWEPERHAGANRADKNKSGTLRMSMLYVLITPGVTG